MIKCFTWSLPADAMDFRERLARLKTHTFRSGLAFGVNFVYRTAHPRGLPCPLGNAARIAVLQGNPQCVPFVLSYLLRSFQA